MQNFDFVAIGDIVTDAFIRLKDAKVHCKVDHDNCELCMRFGDKIPYEFVEVISAVGNSPNAAVSAARLGLKTALVTDLGNDDIANDSIAALKGNGVDTSFVSLHDGMKSNYHYVLWFEDDRTILLKHFDYPYSFPDVGNPKWLYFSSVGEQSLPYHHEIIEFLKSHPETKLAFQPGTFQMKLGFAKLRELYQHTEIFFCNVEEAQRMLSTEEKNVGKLLRLMREEGPKTIVITDGPRGAYAYDGSEAWFMPPYPDPKPPYERTGAGDAFASTLTSALALGKSLDEALMWGPINSMSVVQEVGAQKGLLKRGDLENYLAHAPANYKPQKITE
jgi:sugar/nucleoside kinase (ribokinase family)